MKRKVFITTIENMLYVGFQGKEPSCQQLRANTKHGYTVLKLFLFQYFKITRARDLTKYITFNYLTVLDKMVKESELLEYHTFNHALRQLVNLKFLDQQQASTGEMTYRLNGRWVPDDL